MIPLITPAAMRDMENRYFNQTGTPSIELMERAARALCDAIARRFGPGRRVFFACGPGGNGGDGYACARLYKALGGDAAVFIAAPPASPDAAKNLDRAKAAGVPVLTLDACDDAPDVWVDALYGTGLNRAPVGEAARLIERMNADKARGASVVAVDIPSGLNGASGRAYPPAVRADVTYTFQYAKAGCHLADGLDLCGEIEALDIGIPGEYYPEGQPALMDDAALRKALPARRRNVHKGHFGHLLIVAGSVGMAGAAALCAQAALRSGAGLVTVACPGAIVPILQILAPCAMCVPLPETEGALDARAAEALKAILPGKSAVCCGCGLSRRAAPEVVEALMDSGLPALFDADALNLISESPALRDRLKPHHLLTPHPGEAARLLGRAPESPLEDAAALSSLGCQALLKGAASVVFSEDRAVISASGGPGMARGGSGDCLAGVIGALMAQRGAHGAELTGKALAECAAVGSEIHGLAGEIAEARLGACGMTAQDIVLALPEAFHRYA